MLPSSGAWQLSTNGPMPTRAASADTAAIATGPRPMPPHSAGMCGHHRPHSSRAFRRSSPISPTHAARSPAAALTRSEAGRTSPSMNCRTFRRTSSTSGGNEKSMAMCPASCVRELAARPQRSRRRSPRDEMCQPNDLVMGGRCMDRRWRLAGSS
jgi:hypothetical protein